MPPITLDSTLGALEIGCLLSVFSFGILCAQIHTYHGRFKGESDVLDFAVFVTCCLDLGHTVCLAHSIYVATIKITGVSEKVDGLVNIPTLPLAILFSCLTELVVRLVYIHRIQRLSGNQYIVAFLYVLSVLTCIGGIWACTVAFTATSFSGLFQQWSWVTSLTLTLIVVADSTIAITLCYYLKKSSKWLGRPSRLINILIRWTLETGLLTSLTALAHLICYHSMPGSLVYLAIYALLPKLYSNSLLALLNGRFTLRDITAEACPLEFLEATLEVQPASPDARPGHSLPSDKISVFKPPELTSDHLPRCHTL